MSNQSARILSGEILPHLFAFTGLVLGTLLVDAGLHLLGLVWVGRYLGIPGVLLIVSSFGYSLHKRKVIKAGKPVELLRLHERMAWAGSLLVMVHAGVHFASLLAWLAVVAMLVNVASGLTGKIVLDHSRARLVEARQRLRDQGLSPEVLEDRLYWDSLTFDAVKQWRVVHYPITLAFVVLGLAHIGSALLFWSWR